MFRSEDSIAKVAGLVRTFRRLGGQQLQLNALSAGQLLDAKAHPEHHRDLIVRVWGWSGYFCELSPEYQDHVISRHLYGGQSCRAHLSQQLAVTIRSTYVGARALTAS